MGDSFYEVVRYDGELNSSEEAGQVRLSELAKEIGQIVDTISYNEEEYDIADLIVDSLKSSNSDYSEQYRYSRYIFNRNPFPILDKIQLLQMQWWQCITKSNNTEKTQTTLAILTVLDYLREQLKCEYDSRRKVHLIYWSFVLLHVFKDIISTKPDYDDFEKVFAKILNVDRICFSDLFKNYLMPMIEQEAQKNKISEPIATKIDEIASELFNWHTKSHRIIADRLLFIIGKQRPLDREDVWANAAIADIAEMDTKHSAAWKEILAHSLRASGTKPSKSWLDKAHKRLEAVEPEKFKGYVKGWFELTKVPTIRKPTEEQIKLLEFLKNTSAADFKQTFMEVFEHNYNLYLPFDHDKMLPEEVKQESIKRLNIRDIRLRFTERNSNILKGLAWFCVLIADEDIIKSLRELAIQCYTTIPEIGPLSAGVGNACIYVFTESSSTAALAALQKLEHKIKNANLQKVLHKAYDAVSAKLGVGREELEELGMEEFGFGDNNLCERNIDKHTAAISINPDGKTAMMWSSNGSKLRKAMPAELKDFEYEQQVKDVKKTAKDIAQAFTIGRIRLEKMLLSQREMEPAKWKKHYLEQELIRLMARNLIWECVENQKVTSFIWQNGSPVDANGRETTVNENCRIRLWHPLSSKAEMIKKWQEHIERNKIEQPFKQAFREIYVAIRTERESDASTRFSEYTLKQAQFSRLCKDRGWRFAQHLVYCDSDSPYLTPTLEIETSKIRVEFQVEPDCESEKMESVGFWTYLISGDIVFKNFEGAVLKIENVPPIIFSEVMRDIDLFVSVAGTVKNA